MENQEQWQSNESNQCNQWGQTPLISGGGKQLLVNDEVKNKVISLNKRSMGSDAFDTTIYEYG